MIIVWIALFILGLALGGAWLNHRVKVNTARGRYGPDGQMLPRSQRPKG